MTNIFFKDPNNRKHADIKTYLANIARIKEMGDELVGLKSINHDDFSMARQGSV